MQFIWLLDLCLWRRELLLHDDHIELDSATETLLKLKFIIDGISDSLMFFCFAVPVDPSPVIFVCLFWWYSRQDVGWDTTGKERQTTEGTAGLLIHYCQLFSLLWSNCVYFLIPLTFGLKASRGQKLQLFPQKVQHDKPGAQNYRMTGISLSTFTATSSVDIESKSDSIVALGGWRADFFSSSNAFDVEQQHPVLKRQCNFYSSKDTYKRIGGFKDEGEWKWQPSFGFTLKGKESTTHMTSPIEKGTLLSVRPELKERLHNLDWITGFGSLCFRDFERQVKSILSLLFSSLLSISVLEKCRMINSSVASVCVGNSIGKEKWNQSKNQ